MYGTTAQGGANGQGTLFRLEIDATFTKLHDFAFTDGADPQATLVVGPDGALYGVTSYGGAYGTDTSGYGTLFKLETNGTFTKLHDFNGTDGAWPALPLTVGSDGALYGTAVAGGAAGTFYGFGTLFKLETSGAFTKLHDFSLADGFNTYEALTLGPDGALYGACGGGGASNDGTLFKLATDGTFTTLHDFNGSDGGIPLAQLTVGPDGDLYGSTVGGGILGNGTLFKTDTNGAFTKLHDFALADGIDATAALTPGLDGALYGAAAYGGAYGAGTLFKVDQNGAFTKVHDFTIADGRIPITPVVVGPDGALYGTTDLGGPDDSGTLFSVQANGAFSLLHVFGPGPDVMDGHNPEAPLVVGSDGALYGSTVAGGGANLGTLFKLQTNGTVSKPHEFIGADGSSPTVEMVTGPDGAVYGTTPAGGLGGFGGVLFKLGADGTFIRLHDFGSDVGPCDTPLVMGPDGALYGLTTAGGPSRAGTIFRVDTYGNYTQIHVFDVADGALADVYGEGADYHDSPLVVGPDGTLYGSSPFAGGYDFGTLFKIQADGTFTQLHDFAEIDGYGTRSALVVGPDGAMYGTAQWGGALVFGTIYKIAVDGTFTKLHDFSGGADGGVPVAPPVVGPDGALYGSTTTAGGTLSGTLFKVTTDGTFTVLHTFSDASSVVSQLTVGRDGALYGVAPQGGIGNLGILFRLETSGAFTKLCDFSSTSGSRPSQPLVAGPDGALYGSTQTGGPNDWGTLFKVVLPQPTPVISSLTPSQTVAGSGDFSMTVTGTGFLNGARVFLGGVEVAVTYLGTTQLQANVAATALPTPVDFATIQVTVLNPGGGVSQPAAFTVVAAAVSGSVSQVQSGVAAPGQTATVQTAPSDSSSPGVTASLQNTDGTAPATVTAATYTQNPTPAPAFEAGGGFVDLQVSGARPTARLSSSFYYPQTVTGAAETALTLKFFNGTAWVDVLSSGGLPPAKNTTDNLDGTVSGGRFQVVFDSSSTPPITALNGTVFAVAVPDTTPPQISCPNVTVACALGLTVPVTYPAPSVSDNVDPSPRVTYSIPSGSGFPVGTTTVTATATDAAGNPSQTTFTVTRAPLQFTGFLSPIGGADSTGGSFSAPVRTFKAGSTIPIKFTAQCGGSAVTTGVHRLQVVKYTNATTAGTPIDATPQGAATTGDQFQYSSAQWQFNLDTKDTGMTTGIWLLSATLSDGSQHSVWVQIK
jgi:uncharacterized repeat protein (TIGR03803 family)